MVVVVVVMMIVVPDIILYSLYTANFGRIFDNMCRRMKKRDHFDLFSDLDVFAGLSLLGVREW